MTKARTLESRGNISPLFTGCTQIYHQRWYICVLSEGQVSLAMDNASKLAYAEGVVCLAAAKRGKGQQAALRNSPSQAALATLKRSPASLCEHLRSDKSQSAAFICPQSL